MGQEEGSILLAEGALGWGGSWVCGDGGGAGTKAVWYFGLRAAWGYFLCVGTTIEYGSQHAAGSGGHIGDDASDARAEDGGGEEALLPAFLAHELGADQRG